MYCSAQDKSRIALPKVNLQDFKVPVSPVIDSSTTAVVLQEVGVGRFVVENSSRYSMVTTQNVREQILDKRAFLLRMGEFHIYANSQEEAEATVRSIKGVTYNLEHGVVVETPLDKKDIFLIKNLNSLYEISFTMPALREGSIFDYCSTSYLKNVAFIPGWSFQRIDIPVLYSEYNLETPQTFSYVMIRKGLDKFAVDQAQSGWLTYDYGSDQVSMHQWVMKDVPSFHQEPYLSTPSNYLDKISFQLKKYGDSSFLDTWGKLSETLLKEYGLSGMFVDDNSWLDDWMEKKQFSRSDLSEAARSVYHYLNTHFACTRENGIFPDGSIKELVKQGHGSVVDLNLLLLATLRKLGLTADPVILSTRSHGKITPDYPALSQFNYVIVRTYIDGKPVFLDVSNPGLAFGRLPSECYNGAARVVNSNNPSPVFLDADSLDEHESTLAFLYKGERGLEGTIQTTLGPQESFKLRRRIGADGPEQYLKEIQSDWQNEAVSNLHLDSLEHPELPLTIHYELTSLEWAADSVLYINPLSGIGYTKNPFQMEERTYPVEIEHKLDKNYLVNIDIPEGYKVEEMPRSTKVAFNGNEGSFEYLIGRTDNRIQLRCRLTLNRANFFPEDYKDLRAFFTYVVKKSSEPVVLKKI